MKFACRLPFDHDDETGVYFGRLDNSVPDADGFAVEDSQQRDKMPAMMVIPHLVWEARERPKEMVAFFRFDGVDDDRDSFASTRGPVTKNVVTEEFPGGRA